MDTGITIGLTGTKKATATEGNSAIAMGSGGIETYATPAMIALMEGSAVVAIDKLLPDGHASVGIEINIKHMAATPLGQVIKATAEVTSIDKRRINFKLEAWDETEKIGEGTHTRVIINIERFKERLNDKSNKSQIGR